MAESKNAKKAAQAAAVSEEKVEESAPHEALRREHKKSRWTLELCKRAARRFDHRDAWQWGAPASFKAAVAKGWDKECCVHMSATATNAGRKAKSPGRAKVVKTAKTGKGSAPAIAMRRGKTA